MTFKPTPSWVEIAGGFFLAYLFGLYSHLRLSPAVSTLGDIALALHNPHYLNWIFCPFLGLAWMHTFRRYTNPLLRLRVSDSKLYATMMASTIYNTVVTISIALLGFTLSRVSIEVLFNAPSHPNIDNLINAYPLDSWTLFGFFFSTFTSIIFWATLGSLLTGYLLWVQLPKLSIYIPIITVLIFLSFRAVDGLMSPYFRPLGAAVFYEDSNWTQYIFPLLLFGVLALVPAIKFIWPTNAKSMDIWIGFGITLALLWVGYFLVHTLRSIDNKTTLTELLRGFSDPPDILGSGTLLTLNAALAVIWFHTRLLHRLGAIEFSLALRGQRHYRQHYLLLAGAGLGALLLSATLSLGTIFLAWIYNHEFQGYLLPLLYFCIGAALDALLFSLIEFYGIYQLGKPHIGTISLLTSHYIFGILPLPDTYRISVNYTPGFSQAQQIYGLLALGLGCVLFLALSAISISRKPISAIAQEDQ